MNTTNFEYLLALEEIGTITGVANKYFISPSAVSQCLKNEEKQIGKKLFHYENHHMNPTEAGLIYLKGARRIVEISKETYGKLNIIPQNHNSVRIATAPVLYEKVSTILIPELNAKLPEIKFELLRTDSRVSLAYLCNNFADFALVFLPSLNHALLSEEILGEDQLCLIVPKAYLRSYLVKEPTIEDCDPLPFILLNNGSYMREAENEILVKHHISMNRIYEVDDFNMARNFLNEGRGATFLPAFMIPEHAEKHFFILPVNPPKKFKFILAYPNYKKIDQTKRNIPKLIKKGWRNLGINV